MCFHIMTPNHDRWEEFRYMLACKLGLRGSEGWKCDDTYNKSRKILDKFDVNVDASIAYLSLQGGVCDCEILTSVHCVVEADEIDPEDLEAAADMWDALVSGEDGDIDRLMAGDSEHGK